jgi:CHAT domain-containing protein
MNIKQWFLIVLMFLGCQGLIAQSGIERTVDSLHAVAKRYAFSDSLEAAQAVQQALEKLVLENFGRESRPWASALVNKARIAVLEKDTIGEHNYLKESIELFEKFGISHRDLGIAYNNFGVLHKNIYSDYNTASVFFSKALELKHIHKDDSSSYYLYLGNVGAVQSALEKYEEAVEVGRRCLRFFEDNLEDNMDNYLTISNNLAANLRTLGKYNEADQIYLKIKGVFEKRDQISHLEYASNLESLGDLYFFNYDNCSEEAEGFYLEALELYKKKLGEKSQEYLRCLFSLVLCNGQLNRYRIAENYLLEYESIISKLFGTKSVEYAQSISEIGSFYEVSDHIDQALEKYIEAAKILEINGLQNEPYFAKNLSGIAYLLNQVGKTEESIAKCRDCIMVCANNPDKNSVRLYYTDCLSTLVNIFVGKSQYLEAIPLLEEARKYYSIHFDGENDDYINILLTLANACNKSGLFEKAESLYLEIKLLMSNDNGLLLKNHISFVYGITDLYLRKGQVFEAEKVYLEALASLEEYPEEQLIDLFASAGAFYTDLGNFNDAEKLLLKAKNLISNHVGKETNSDAFALQRLGFLYSDLGRDLEAIFTLEEALFCYAKNVGVESPEYAECLGVLASAYRVNDEKKAEQLFLEAKSIMERNSLTAESEYDGILKNLAIFYYYTGHYQEAERLYIERINSYENELDKKTTDYADLLNNIAVLYTAMGKCDEAEMLLKEVRSIREVTTNRESTDFIKCFKNLASLYYAQDKFDAAIKMKDTTVLLVHKVLSESILFSSEKDMLEQSENFYSYLEDLPSYLHTGNGSNQVASLIYNDALFQKGFVQTTARRLNLRSSATPEADSINQQLKSCRYILSKEYIKPLEERKNVAELETKATELERQLARKVSGYAENISQVKWQQVQSALQPGEAAIEFIRFQVLLPAKKDSFMYAALVVKPGLEAPEYISLCEEKELDVLLLKGGVRKQDYVGRIYSTKERGIIEVGAEDKSVSVHQLLWKPLEPSLKDVNKVYYSNAGLMHRINHAAISITHDSTLADRYQLVQFGSTRSLVQPDKVENPNLNAVLMGGIQYDADSTALQTAVLQLDSFSYATRGELRFFRPDSTETYIESWDVLANTAKETTQIAATLKKFGFATNRLHGYDATEEAFHKLSSTGSSPRVIHIATHGFFLPDPKESFKEFEKNVYKQSDNPLIRSGLILAGGNHAWNTGKSIKPGFQDGILTAYEISQTNLSNTELVVLSACETGLGDIQGNEGVYGLQRAFKIAGVKYLIMSLWQVPDSHTSAFMTQFYKNWLENKMTIPDAFRQTQQEMRERFLDPYSWAGFVLIE